MKRLSYSTLSEIGFDGYVLKQAPERMLQFGEGNFLRAFVDYFVDEMNEKANFDCKVVVCQPIEHGMSEMINEQEGLYTLYLRGSKNGEEITRKRVISSVSRCINPYHDFDSLLQVAKNPELRFIASNTTEAGIVYDGSCRYDDRPPHSFPAKLTRFLHERFLHFGSDDDKGVIILACELIDNNGNELKKCVLKHIEDWELSAEFRAWIEKSNIFCSTLVDRIVTGYPKGEAPGMNEKNSYEDNLIATAESFGFWVIEGDERVSRALPSKKAGLPIVITDDHTPYKQRKVRILNGAHTTMVLGAYLAGKSIVRECMVDDVIRTFMYKTIFDEIIPTLTLPHRELVDFANSVIDRFKNPFIDHELLAISLNSTSKWRARVLPSLLRYVEMNQVIPARIAASLAFYIEFYRKSGTDYTASDDTAVLYFFEDNSTISLKELTKKVLQNKELWGRDLTEIDGLEAVVYDLLMRIETDGAYGIMANLQ